MRRTTLIVCAVGAVVVILVWYFFLFAPASSDLNDTRDEVSAIERQNQELENTIRQLEALSRNSVEQQARLRTLQAAIPTTPDLGEFILQANEMAAAAGIDWLSIAPTPPTATGGSGPTSTIAISMQISGQFSAVLDYLTRLEDLERLVVVDSVNLSGESAEASTGSTGEATTSTGGAPDLSVTLTGRMFTQAQATAAPGSGTVTPTPTTPGATTPTTVPGSPSSSTVPSTTPPASSSGSSS